MEAIVDLEIAMIKAFGWSPYEIDESDTESLVMIINRMTGNDAPGSQGIYCDQVDFL